MAGAGVFSPAPAPCSQKVRLHNTAHELREAIAYSRLARTLFYPIGITHYGRPGIRKAFRPSRAGGHSGLKTLIFLSGFKRPREHEEGMEEGKGRYWAKKR